MNLVWCMMLVRLMFCSVGCCLVSGCLVVLVLCWCFFVWWGWNEMLVYCCVGVVGD